MTTAKGPILEVDHLVKSFAGQNARPAVDGVSFSLQRGQALGLVGESGSGKTTVARCIFGLETADEGKVTLDDSVIVNGPNVTISKPMRRRMQMVFQDPYSSLNPALTIGKSIREGLATHRLVSSRAEADARVAELLDAVGLAASYRNRHPSELSGGQCQRAGIARALAVQPELLVCDEPVSALDVSIRAQVLNLFIELKTAMGLSLLFIGHDLSVVRRLCEDMIIMRLGRVVESGPREWIFSSSTEPYTQALVAATPVPDPRRERDRQLARREVEAAISQGGDEK